MPYILSNIISKKNQGMWGEGAPYETISIYSIDSCNQNTPPVNYDAHIIRPHSIPHMDAPGHIVKGGNTIDYYYRKNKFDSFYGNTLVVRLKGNKFVPDPMNSKLKIWRVTLEELKVALNDKNPPDRLLLTANDYPEDSMGNHSQDHVLVLSTEAAEWLIEKSPKFCMYGTSWKSADFQPGNKDRPIHNIFMNRNVSIFECLNLRDIPEGEYFWTAFPLPLEGASESPVCPVLYSYDELKFNPSK